MKTETITNYAKVLLELGQKQEDVTKTQKILEEHPELQKVLTSPVITGAAKSRLIDKIFPEPMQSFLKVACRHGRIEALPEIFREYRKLADREQGILRARLFCVSEPKDFQREQMKAFLMRRYHAKQVILEIQEEKSLLGGFLLRAGEEEFDWSLRGRFRRLEQRLTK